MRYTLRIGGICCSVFICLTSYLVCYACCTFNTGSNYLTVRININKYKYSNTCKIKLEMSCFLLFIMLQQRWHTKSHLNHSSVLALKHRKTCTYFIHRIIHKWKMKHNKVIEHVFKVSIWLKNALRAGSNSGRWQLAVAHLTCHSSCHKQRQLPTSCPW